MINIIKYLKVLIPILMPLPMVLFGTFGFMLVENWSFIDSLYMSVITLTTVGFEEVHHLSTSGRLFTILLLFMGLGTFLYLVGEATQGILQNFSSYNKIKHKKKMQSRINKLNNHVIICGLGRIGSNLAEQLINSELDFVVIDQEYKENIDPRMIIINGDATDENILFQAGIERAKTLVVLAGEDSINVLITMTARELSKSINIISRYINDKSKRKLVIAGANDTLNPHKVGGEKILEILLFPIRSTFFKKLMENSELSPVIEEVEIKEANEFCGKTIAETKIRDNFRLLVISLETSSGEFVLSPNANHYINSGDRLLLVGTRRDVQNFTDKISAIIN